MIIRPGEYIPALYVDFDDTIRHGPDHLPRNNDGSLRFVNGPDDVVIFPEAVAQMRAWKAGGGRIIGVTNQGGIALGHLDITDALKASRQTLHLSEHLIDHVAMCPHHPHADDPIKARCSCRKPYPGLLIAGMTALSLRTGEVYPASMALMVGDRDEDRLAAEAANIDFEWASEWRARAQVPAGGA